MNGAGFSPVGYNSRESFAGKLRIRHAINWIEKGTKAGDVEAMNMPAMIYEQGMGVEADDETAKSWRMHATMAKANRAEKKAP